MNLISMYDGCKICWLRFFAGFVLSEAFFAPRKERENIFALFEVNLSGRGRRAVTAVK
jgi:hypothetical protein